MSRRRATTEERLAGLREVITAANGNWEEAVKLWSVQADLDWLLARAEGEPARDIEMGGAIARVLVSALSEELPSWTLDDYAGLSLVIVRAITPTDAAPRAYLEGLRSRRVDGGTRVTKGAMECAVEAAWEAATSPVGDPADGVEMHDLAKLAAGILDYLAAPR